MKWRYRIISAALVFSSGSCLFAIRCINHKVQKLFPLTVVSCNSKSLFFLIFGVCFWASFCLLFFFIYKKIDPNQFSKINGWFVVIAGLMCILYYLIPILRYQYNGALSAYLSSHFKQPASCNSIIITNDKIGALKLNDDAAADLSTLFASSEINSCIPYHFINTIETSVYDWDLHSSISMYFPSETPYALDEIQISFYSDAILSIKFISPSSPYSVPLLFYIKSPRLYTFITSITTRGGGL